MALDEFDAIRRHFRPLATAPGALGLADDAGILRPAAGDDLVVTTDALVGGVHFLLDDPPADIGHKALAVNLSDLAAMGAEPLCYTLAVALPAGWPAAATEAWLAAFCRGLALLQDRAGISLLGGDTVATPGPPVLSITAIGRTAAGIAVHRAGARPGDRVCVSGAIGDAVLGLDILAGRLAVPDPAARAALVDRYRRPEPRLALGRRLPGLASAAADISDGLVGDLAHICRASGVVARLDLDRLPLSVAARTALAAVGGAVADARARLATGGDDYELVFTIAAGDLPALAERGDSPPITVVGDVLGMGAAAGRAAEAEDSLLVQVVSNGRILPIPRGGYRHHIGAPPQNPEEK